MFGFLRRLCAIVFGMGVTCATSAILVAGTLMMFGSRLRIPLLQAILRQWAFAIEAVVRFGCGVRVRDLSPGHPIRKAAPGQVTLCIANHPSFFAASLIPDYLFSHCGGRFVGIAKRELFWHPAGLALWAAGAGIFIDRDGKRYSKEQLADDIRTLCGSGDCTLVIFPDKSRPNKERIAHDRAQGRAIPGIDQEYQYTLAPRARAVRDIVEALRSLGVELQAIDMTIGVTKDDTSVFGWLWNLDDAEILIEIAEVELPGSVAIHDFLNRLWRRKNEQIRKWKRE